MVNAIEFQQFLNNQSKVCMLTFGKFVESASYIEFIIITMWVLIVVDLAYAVMWMRSDKYPKAKKKFVRGVGFAHRIMLALVITASFSSAFFTFAALFFSSMVVYMTAYVIAGGERD
jgi:hypothetical protein